MTKKLIAVLISVNLLTITPLGASPIMPSGVTEEAVATQVLWQSLLKMEKSDRPKIILVLGGGGAKGLSHIGVLRAFEQENIPVDEIIGISVGALMGALYAGGVSVNQLEQMAQDVGWNKLTDYSKFGIMRLILKEELFSTEKMESYLETHLGKKTFSELNIPFSCVATDITTGERVVFKDGPVAIAARASATIPGIFRPVEYRQRLLVDGGLVASLPTDVADNKGNTVLVGVLPKGEYEKFEVNSIFSALIRSIEIQKDVNLEKQKELADFLIRPDLGDITASDLTRTNDAIDAGVRGARKEILELKKLILQRVVETRERNIGER